MRRPYCSRTYWTTSNCLRSSRDGFPEAACWGPGHDDFESVRTFARIVAELVVSGDPSLHTLEQHKNKCAGRLFVDVNRNAYAQTVAVLYAVRARKGAPVSVPLRWNELHQKNFRADGVTMQTVFERLDQIEDPWKDFWRRAASLDKARGKLERLHAA